MQKMMKFDLPDLIKIKLVMVFFSKFKRFFKEKYFKEMKILGDFIKKWRGFKIQEDEKFTIFQN